MDDIEAIKQLKVRFTRAIDHKDWERCRDLLTDDFSMASPTGTATTGADEFIGHFKKALTDIFTVHHADARH